MAATVIDLISSEPFDPLASSPPKLPEPAPRRDSFLRLSDSFDSSGLGGNLSPVPPKRRRLTPPKQVQGPGPAVVRRSPRIASKRASYDDVDAIVLSSPPLARRALNGSSSRAPTAKYKTKEPFDLFDEFDDTPQKPTTSNQNYSDRTALLLAKLDSNRRNGGAYAGASTSTATMTTTKTDKPKSKGNTSAPVLSSIEDPSSQMAPPPAKRKTRLTTPEKEQKARNKTQEKEAATAARALLKAEKQKEKQLAADLVEVNKARHDKKISVGEMILRMPERFFERNIGRLTEDVAKQLGVQVEFYSSPESDVIGDVLTWKRKVRARFDAEVGHWVPLARREVQKETSHVLYPIDANAFVKLVQWDAMLSGDIPASASEDMTEATLGLDDHANTLKGKWPEARPIYLIEGLETFMRKSKNARNRSYQAAVRAQDGAQTAPAAGQNKRRRKQNDDVLVDDDMVEDGLLRLQVEHNCLIHHTSSAAETAEWIGNFTQHISTIPYKNQQNTAEASFCMDVGQVRTGDDKDDTYVKMLQEIVRVTLPVAYGVAARYPTVISLVQAMRQHGPMLLEDLKKCSNKNGSFTDARIGPALSKRIYKVFMGTNPDSMDV